MQRLPFGRLRFSALVMCSAWVLSPDAAHSQNHSQLFAAVVNQAGEPVLDLTADDFEVAIDNKVVALDSVELDAAFPKIAMLVDRGHTMYESRADGPLREGLTTFVDGLAPQFEAAIFTIAPQVQRREDFTTDREELRDAINGIFTEELVAAKLIDGMFETWERRFEEEDPFPVFVLVLGEGADDSSFFTPEEYTQFVEALLARHAVVHAVVLSRGLSVPGVALPQISENLTENTGGRYLNINQTTGLTDSLAELAGAINHHADQVASRYRLLYDAPDEWTDISVRLGRPGLSLQLFSDRSLPVEP